MTDIWSATVTRIGDDAPEMFDAGCYILFGEPVPDALADVSIVHDGAGQAAEVRPGDDFWIGEDRFTVAEVGDLTWSTSVDVLSRLVLATLEGVTLQWLVDRDDEAAAGVLEELRHHLHRMAGLPVDRAEVSEAADG